MVEKASGMGSETWAALSVQWLSPSACFPPHRVTRPEQVIQLEAAFREAAAKGSLGGQTWPPPGWDLQRPPLVGYPYREGIQLLSGSHRWAAAARAGIKVPVKIVPYSAVWDSWGHLERWLEIMRTGGEHGMGGE